MSAINKIIYLLKKNDISARKLTLDLNLANSSVSEWKKGKANPSIDAVIKIAKYFGVTTDYLLMEDDLEHDSAASIESDSDKETVENPCLIQKEDLSECKFDSAGPAELHQNKIEELTKEDRELLNYYHRLDEKDKQYIWCKIVVLEREYAE